MSVLPYQFFSLPILTTHWTTYIFQDQIHVTVSFHYISKTLCSISWHICVLAYFNTANKQNKKGFKPRKCKWIRKIICYFKYGNLIWLQSSACTWKLRCSGIIHLLFILCFVTTGKIIVLTISKISCQQQHQHACADSLLSSSKCSEMQKSEGLKVWYCKSVGDFKYYWD